jgi:DNA-binding Lrp family transcriptional regulator
VYRHRFLRSSDIANLVGGSRQQILRRLQLLFHNGYLTRPRAQLDYYTKGGSREIVYGLGNTGAKLLKDSGAQLVHLRWNEKSQGIGRMFLNHALLVSSIMVAFELACGGDAELTFIQRDSLMAADKRPLRWRVRMNQNTSLGVVPDEFFAIETATTAGGRVREYFFLEADRGTMPVIRKSLSQTSMFRKLLAYEATWKQELHKTRFGFPRFRVLIVTTRAERTASLMEACSKLKSGHGLFLISHREAITQSEKVLEVFWKNGKGEATPLLPQAAKAHV